MSEKTLSKLRAKDPKEAEPSKPKIILFGASGVGKTWFTLSFPSIYYIAPEDGANRKHYTDRLKAGGGVYLGPEDGALDFDTVIEQTKALATEKHPYKTVAYDSISKLFNNAVQKEADRLGDKNGFGADKKYAIGQMRRLVAQISRLDMNVLFIAHEAAEWGNDDKGNRVEVGKIPDVWNKLIYELDLALHAQKRGPKRVAVTRKSRLLGFPEGESFDLDYDAFAERYGKDVIEREVQSIILATPEQVAQLIHLCELLKIEEATKEKWFEKYNAEKFEEFTSTDAAKIIEALKSKIK